MITKSCYRLCLNIKTLNHEDSFQCVNVQRVHSPEILLTYYGWGVSFGPVNEIMNVTHYERKEKNAWHPGEILHLQRNQKRKSDKWQTRLTEQSNIRNNSETFPLGRAAHIRKERGPPTHITHKDSTPEQLPKRPHRGHYTVNKNSGKKMSTPKRR